MGHLSSSCFFSLPFFFSPDGHGQFKASYTGKNPNIIYFLNIPMTYTCLYGRVLCIKMAKTSPYLWTICDPTQDPGRSSFLWLRVFEHWEQPLKSCQASSTTEGRAWQRSPWGLQHVPGSGSSRRWSTRPPQFCLELWDRRWEITQAGEKQCGRRHGKMSSFLH